MFFPLRSNLSTSPLTAAHHASRLALTLMASLLLAACGSSTPAPATPTPTPLLAPDLSVVNPQPYTQDTDITPLVFGNTGGDVTDDATGCDVDNSGGNDLPLGLMVRVFPDNGKRTCRITGTPMEVVSPARMVTITATNTAGSDTATVSITVNPAATPLAAPNLGAVNAQTYTQNTAITDLVFTNTGGDVNAIGGCAVDTSNGKPALPTGLSVGVVTDNNDSGKRTCQIIGTPMEVVSPARMVTITATNVTGSDTVTVSIIVNPPDAPNLSAASAQTYIQNTAITDLVFTNTGGDVNAIGGCAVDTSNGKPALPTGLSVGVVTDNNDSGKRTCQIIGTPMEVVSPARMVTITATNVTESDTVTVSIIVNPPDAPNLSVASAQTYIQNTAITDLVFTNTGGDVNAIGGCAVDTSNGKPALPTGLSVGVVTDNNDSGKRTCQIIGTPMEVVSPARMVTITATNVTESDTVTVSIIVNPPDAPNLSAASAQTYIQNTAITDLVFTNTGGDVTNDATGCTIDKSGGKPALPTGLMVGVVTDNNGKRTCQITGMPMEAVSPARMVTITAANVTGSDTVTVPITVSSGIVPDSLSGQSLFRYEAGQTVPVTRQITFTNFGGDLTSCTVPDMIDGMPNGLPDGMSIDFDDCAISGEPLRIMAETTTHTITATHMGGATSTATISIETYLSAPPSLSNYSGATLDDGTFAGVTLVMGSTVGLPIVLENTGGLVGENGCQVSSDNTGGEQPLSSLGLALAVTDGNSSCEIRAMNNTDPAAPIPPTATIAKTGYSITATNDLGISGAIATFTIIGTDVALAAPTLTAPTGSPFMFATNTAIDAIKFALGGRKLGICTISPALPAGLRFDPSTCQISGTPRTASMTTQYTVTATNNTSPAATATVVITVTDTAAPALESMVALKLTMNSNVGLPFAIANTGGSPTSCIPTPTTAGDDDLDSYNLTAMVADGTCVIDSPDGNGPSRTLDGGSFTITLSNGATTILTLNLRTPITPQIVAGHDRTFAVNSAGQLFGWGSNFANLLGLGDLDDSLNPIPAPALFTGNDWVQADSSHEHACAINASGGLFCWGLGGDGQLGLGNIDNDNNGTIDNANTPTQVGSASNWAQVSTGLLHTCAINTSGGLFCWGLGGNGQLGLGNNDSTNTPTQVVMVQEGDMPVDSATKNWVQVSAGARHTCAIEVSGKLWCWGLGNNGRLGLGDITDISTPTQVGSMQEGSATSNWAQVSAGSNHTCAINASAGLFCWGFGDSGRLGLGNNNEINTPMQVGSMQEGSATSNWAQVSTGSSHTCAINTSGQLFCWGNNKTAQLGLGDNTAIRTPTQVGDADDWAQVNAGRDHQSNDDHTCAIKTSGQLWCWGFGESGQLGLGSNTNMNTPTLVPNFLLQ